MTDAATLPEARLALPTVQTDDGPITVVSIGFLQKTADEARAQSAQLAAQAAAAHQQGLEAASRAGSILVANRTRWSSGERAAGIDAAAGLADLVASLERSLTDLKAREHHGLGGLVERVKESHEARELEAKLRSAQVELGNRYRDVAAGLADTGIPDADQLLAAATAHSEEASLLSQRSTASAEDYQRIEAELKRRNDVQRKLGFDALGVEADLDLNGFRPIVANIVLKPKEVAGFQTTATLCRFSTRTQYVGASQGFSIPLGHGFRYRVGTYSGHPVQSQFLARTDSGSLVVTNQRLVFLGSKRDVAVPLAKLISVEPYSDAISIGREGKEGRDIYLVARPAEVLLYLNWAVSHQS